ncbi:MAG: hypothetical protein ACD_22C00166G0007 [uncultured bacterium]|nr:MAG: hypothetical protein ACD_22C00166G0007 [uncultured bacterium]
MYEYSEYVHNSPLYRLFRVLLIIGYVAVFGAAVLGGMLGLSERSIKSATLICSDGTRWDAEDILYDNEAQCGLCTKRIGVNYSTCNKNDSGYYSSYNVEKEYEFPWGAITYPLIVLVIGIAAIDLTHVSIFYIVAGKVDLEKSLFLKVVALLTVPEETRSEAQLEAERLQFAIETKNAALIEHRRMSSVLGKLVLFFTTGLLGLLAFFILYLSLVDSESGNITLAIFTILFVSGIDYYLLVISPRKSKEHATRLEREIKDLQAELLNNSEY